jgi:formylglycine-generating enzyme required for sulfatase activity
MKSWIKVCAFAAALVAMGVAQADVVTIGSFVTIGDAGATADEFGFGYGGVSYPYEISRTEVSIKQFRAFTTATGIGETSGETAESYWNDGVHRNVGEDAPAVYVSQVEAMQYCNWLTSEDPYKGAYSFQSLAGNPIGGEYTRVFTDRQSAIDTYGYGNVYVIPNEDEWYKAAYYTGSGWSDYSDGTDGIGGDFPVARVNTNGETYADWDYAWDYDTDSARSAAFGELEQNGTVNMMGNVFELVEDGAASIFGAIVRGGSARGGYTYLRASTRQENFFAWESDNDVGFRVARLIPEPMTIGLTMIGGCVAWFARLKQRV